MTQFYPADRPLPSGTQTPRILLEPLKPAHVELDFDAVVESRQQLRLWSGSSWPADDFSLDDNLRDMQFHWREQQERAAFTYTVLDPAREICLGCVYIRPLSELVPNNPAQLSDVAANDAVARFWVRSAHLDGDLERHLLDTLISWLDREWLFARVLFHTPEENSAQQQLFAEALLQHSSSLDMADRGGLHRFYEV